MGAEDYLPEDGDCLMQWLVNELRTFKKEIGERIDEVIKNWAQGQIQDAERLKKLEDEIKAMKARLGKKQKQEGQEVDR